MHLPARDFDAAQGDDIFARLEAHVVGDVNRRDDESQLLRQVLPQRFHPRQKLASLILVDQRNQAVADFEAEFVEFQQILDRILGRLLVGRGGCRRPSAVIAWARARPETRCPPPAGRKKTSAARESPPATASRRRRSAGDGGTAPAAHIDRQGGVGGGAGHHHASRHRDQQRRDHGDQPVADGQHGVGFQRLAEGDIELEDADQESGDDVDGGNQDGGDGVALVEAGRAVHGAVELGVARDLLAAGARLRFVDQPGVQVGVDRHLLAGHGVEGEARGHLGGAHRAVRHHDVLDGDQGDENHEAHHVVAADHE